MRKKKNYGYYIGIRTHGERVANQKEYEEGVHTKWGRAYRNNKILDPWSNEKLPCIQKTWKVKREKQYRPGKRGTMHTYRVYNDRWYVGWSFKEYCEKHDIPCNVKKINHLESWLEYQSTWEIVGYEPTIGAIVNQLKYPPLHPIYGRVYHYDKPLVKRTRTIHDYVELIWWSDKNIGIEYILRESGV